MTKRAQEEVSVAETMKGLIPDPVMRIRLHEFAMDCVRRAEEALSLQQFPPHGPVTADTVAARVHQYEAAVGETQTAMLLLAFWGEARHLLLLEKMFRRIAEVEKGSAGTVVWLRLGWYPVVMLQYSAGIAALAAKHYEALKVILTTPLSGRELGILGRRAAVVAASLALGEVLEVFKDLSGNPQHYVPLSEYLFQLLRKPMAEVVDIQSEYDDLFDQYEILSALTCADLLEASGSGPRSLLGRFSWKHSRGDGPFKLMLEDAAQFGDAWPPLKTGLFKGSHARFAEIARTVSERVGRLGWL
jgi:hypothetical protein